jgi:hypothetical protein
MVGDGPDIGSATIAKIIDDGKSNKAGASGVTYLTTRCVAFLSLHLSLRLHLSSHLHLSYRWHLSPSAPLSPPAPLSVCTSPTACTPLRMLLPPCIPRARPRMPHQPRAPLPPLRC